MYKSLLPICFLLLLVTACSKKSNVPPSNTNNNSSLLVGNWLVTSEHDRFYNSTNTLAEDTTLNITDKQYAWTNIFNKNGTYYDVDYYDMPVLDTILSAHYSVSNQIINYTDDKDGLLEQYTILKLSTTSLALEEIFYVTPSPGETQNLPPGSYKCVSDTYYTKQ